MEQCEQRLTEIRCTREGERVTLPHMLGTFALCARHTWTLEEYLLESDAWRSLEETDRQLAAFGTLRYVGLEEREMIGNIRAFLISERNTRDLLRVAVARHVRGDSDRREHLDAIATANRGPAR